MSMDQADNTVVELLDEQNQLTQFEHVMTLEVEGAEYVVLHPLEDPDVEDGEVVILTVEQKGEQEETYAVVEDAAVAQRVFEEFLAIMDSEEET